MKNETAETITPTSIERLIDAGKALGKPIELPGIMPSVIVPRGYAVQVLDRREPSLLLDFINQPVALNDARSFLAYVLHFWQKTTQVFYSAPPMAEMLAGNGPKFQAVLDYHANSEQSPERETDANRCAHVVTFACPFSIEWTRWMSVSGKALAQEAFIEFIETNLPDVEVPSGAEIIEMAVNFETASTGRFQNKVDRVTGGRQLTWTNDVDASTTVAGNKIKVPEEMRLSLPVFEGGQVFPMTARVSYDTKGGALKITVTLLRPHLVLREAVASLHEEIGEKLDLLILNGQPLPPPAL